MKTHNEKAFELVNNSIFISGSARSGTTILGKLLSTFNTAEYSFEPPMMFQLLSDLDENNSKLVKGFISTYLCEDVFLGAITGRNMNLRKQDDSSIYNSKLESEILKRLRVDVRKKAIVSNGKRLIFKVPDFVYKEPALTALFPKLTVIRTVRSPAETVNSLIAKGWFSDEGIRRSDLIWPNTKYDDYYIPHWLQKKFHSEWSGFSPVDRCLIYYIAQTESSLKPSYVVDYAKLIKKPKDVLSRLSDELGMKLGPLSTAVLTSIKRQDSTVQEMPDSFSEELFQRSLSAYEVASSNSI